MTKKLTDAKIIANSAYSLEYLKKLKAENPTMFTNKKWDDLRAKVVLSRQRHYYAIKNTKHPERRKYLINQLPRKSQRTTNTVPEIITEKCGISIGKLNAFRRQTPDLFSDEEWVYFKCQLRKQQCVISSFKYRNCKANVKKLLVANTKLLNDNQDNPNPINTGLETPCPGKHDDGELSSESDSQSNTLELSSQSSSIDSSEDNMLDLLMPLDYSSMMMTHEDFNMIDSCNNLFWQPRSP